jgi:hypothetical protein
MRTYDLENLNFKLASFLSYKYTYMTGKESRFVRTYTATDII